MRASVVQAKARFSEIIDAARSGEPVIVTRHGKPVVAVVAVPHDPDDRERFLLAHNPVFRGILEASQASGDAIAHEEFWRAVMSGRRSPKSAEHGNVVDRVRPGTRKKAHRRVAGRGK